MKAILILCLLATLNCNFIDTAFCLIENEKIQDIFTDVFSSIKVKDWIKMVNIIESNLSDIIDIGKECLIPEIIDDKGEIVLQKIKHKPCRNNNCDPSGNIVASSFGDNVKYIVKPSIIYKRKTIYIKPKNKKPIKI